MRQPRLAGKRSLSFREALSALLVANRSRFGAHAASQDYERAETVFGAVIERIPASAFENEEGEPAFQVPLIDVLENPGALIQALIATLQTPELAQANLFRPLLERMWLNVCRVSNVDPADFAQ